MLIVLPSMIVDDLDFPGFAIAPNETDPPLIVDTNTDLTLTVAVQRFQTVAGWRAQVVKLLRCVDCKKLRTSAPLNLRGQVADDVSRKDRCCALVAEALITTIRTA
jgi:hypothetical protein